MHTVQADYRRLYELLLSEGSQSPYSEILNPWFNAHSQEQIWLLAFASRSTGDSVPPATYEDLWRLYALGRVNELLILRFQRGNSDGSDWPGPAISRDEYAAFAEALGLHEVEEQSFSPFCHEIVEVEQSRDDEQPITLLSTFWPCLMLGEMMFSRAGVHVAGGRKFIRKEIAESSTLYWAHRRKNRPYQDQSSGWGGNSQWRTSFRRDYRIGQSFYYSVDGENDLSGPLVQTLDWDGPEMTREARIELLINRCFITVAKPHDDLYPYKDRVMQKG
jgi:hypothetical protein